jgi:hypothetical protein
MIGFALVHSSPMALLVLTPPLAYLWICVLFVGLVRRVVRRRPVPRTIFLDLAVAVFIVGVLWIPYGTWQWLFAGRLAKSPYAAESLTRASCRGDLWTVKACLRRGPCEQTRATRGSDSPSSCGALQPTGRNEFSSFQRCASGHGQQIRRFPTAGSNRKRQHPSRAFAAGEGCSPHQGNGRPEGKGLGRNCNRGYAEGRRDKRLTCRPTPASGGRRMTKKYFVSVGPGKDPDKSDFIAPVRKSGRATHLAEVLERSKTSKLGHVYEPGPNGTELDLTCLGKGKRG